MIGQVCLLGGSYPVEVKKVTPILQKLTFYIQMGYIPIC